MVLRSILAAIVVSVALIGVLAGFARVKHETDREAIRSAYMDGRISREQAVELLGPDADLPDRRISD
jgi:uncharacterized membrane protein